MKNDYNIKGNIAKRCELVNVIRKSNYFILYKKWLYNSRTVDENKKMYRCQEECCDFGST